MKNAPQEMGGRDVGVVVEVMCTPRSRTGEVDVVDRRGMKDNEWPRVCCLCVSLSSYLCRLMSVSVPVPVPVPVSRELSLVGGNLARR